MRLKLQLSECTYRFDTVHFVTIAIVRYPCMQRETSHSLASVPMVPSFLLTLPTCFSNQLAFQTNLLLKTTCFSKQLAFQNNLLFKPTCFSKQLAFQINLLFRSTCFSDQLASQINLLLKSTCFPAFFLFSLRFPAFAFQPFFPFE